MNKLRAAAFIMFLCGAAHADDLPFPARNVEADCHLIAGAATVIYNACIDSVQPDYDLSKLIWPKASDSIKRDCLAQTRQIDDAVHIEAFYNYLVQCLSDRLEAERAKTPQAFHY